MPRRAKGPRLFPRTRKGYGLVYEIRDDGDIRKSTGTADRREAEAALAAYIESKQLRSGKTRSANSMMISSVLNYYGEHWAPQTSSAQRIGYAIDALDSYWGDKPVAAVLGSTCREYMSFRSCSEGTVRRELGVLQAAMNFCVKEGLLDSAPKVSLPPSPAPRERWLTPQEAAWLIRGARALNRDGRHLAYFILCGLYTGSRKQTILNLAIDDRAAGAGYVDTTNGVIYRKPKEKVETTKRQRPARLPPRYLAHLARQARAGRRFVVEDYRGRRVKDIKSGWRRAIRLAEELAAKKDIHLDLSDVVPHTLKHTAITWALQGGATIWDVAGMFSTSVETVQRVYGHHSPDWQKSAVDAMNRKR